MFQPLRAIVVLAIFLSAGFRIWGLAHVPTQLMDLEPIRRAVEESMATKSGELALQPPSIPGQLTELGVTNVNFQQFDPTAVVMMRPGEDGQPGVAGVDDNGNGIVDDNSELGATRSDDVCLVARADQIDASGPKLVLQKGAFVPVTWDQVRGQVRGRTRQARAVVQGQTGQEHWSFLLKLDVSE